MAECFIESVVITGPTGAIGIALIERLIQERIQVYAVCNPESKRLYRLPQSPYVTIIKCDVSNLKQLPQLIRTHCSVFYHFAWLGTTGHARNDMHLQTLNIQYTLDAVDAAEQLGCNTFIGAGSQAEYGRVEGVLSECTPTNPENGYGMAKLCAGQMSRVVCRKYGIRHIWTRILSVYGPCDGMNTMILSAMRSLLNGESPKFTKGEQKWDYLYSKDAGNIMYLLAVRGKDQKVYCLGSGEAKPLSEYINMLKNCVNPEGIIRLGDIPYSTGQVMFLCADTTDIENDLGYKVKYSFDVGIKETYEWLLKEMNNEEN